MVICQKFDIQNMWKRITDDSKKREKFVEIILIRIIYTLLAYLMLNEQWYVGHGSYGISFNIWKEFVSIVAFVIITFVYLQLESRNNFTQLMMILIYTVYFIPVNASIGLNDCSMFYFLSSHCYILVLFVFLSFFSKKGKKNTTCTNAIKAKIKIKVNLFCLALCIGFIIYKISYNGFEFSLSVASDSVYKTRAALQEYLDQISGSLFAYFISILRNLASIVAPFFLLFSLVQKKYLYAFLATMCMLSLFAVTSGKGNLFVIAVVVVLLICEKRKILENVENTERILYLGLLGMLFLCLLEFLIRGKSTIFTILVRREMYLPAWLNTIYYDYFSVHDKILWSQNTFILQNLIQGEYTQSPLEIISQVYFGGQIPSPNTGMFAEAYMNFGVFGNLIYPGLLTGLITFSSSVYEKYGSAINILMAVLLLLQLINIPMVRTDFVLSYTLFTVIMWLLNVDGGVHMLARKIKYNIQKIKIKRKN